MVHKRRYIPASEFCSSVRDGTHDSPKPIQNGRKLITSRHLSAGHLNLSDAYLISEQDFNAVNKRSKVDRYDVLISMIGTVGEVCLIKEEPDFAIKNIGLFKTKSESDGKWLYYFLQSLDAQQYIKSQSRGTTQQYIPLGVLREFPILVCTDPAEQRRIADILGTLDDKIELNRRMNATLEEMARALFKSWFVDFDPVRAKAAGQPTGLPTHIDALFPDRLVDSALGEIPEGWGIGKVGEHTHVGIGKTPPRNESQWFSTDTSDIPWVSIRDMGLANVYLSHTSEFLTETAINKFHIRIVPINTVLLSFKLTVGRVAITDQEMVTNEAIAHFNLPQDSNLTSYYLYLYLKTFDFNSLGSTSSIATAVNSNSIRQMPILIPPKNLVNSYTQLVTGFFQNILINVEQTRTLTDLRGTLLPKLISGRQLTIDIDTF
jgi:type I restriction enzyme S subunit